MSLWYHIAVSVLSLSLWAVLLFREIRRPNKARLAGRLIATTLLIAALAAIALPVGYTSHSTTGNKEGVLLTEGYDPDSARAYLSSRTEVKDVEDVSRLSALHILGYGLTKDERTALPDMPVFFHPSAPQTGIVSLDWNRQILPGEVFRVQGSFYNTTGAPVKLLLFGMNTLLDSVTGLRRQQENFELRTVPVQADRAVYKLIAIAGKDTIEQESIPMEVMPKQELKILMLAAAPGFENKFLAGWLSDKGHVVVVRTAISRNKYDHAYLNTPAMAVDHLTPALLDRFDIVIADAAELKAMGVVAHDYLWHAMAEKGLGLVIKTDSASLGYAEKIIRDGAGQKILLRDSLNRAQVSESMHGAGKIILTTLNTTYARLLAGEKKAYADLWTLVLQEAAKRQGGTEQWHMSPALAAVDHPIELRLQSSAPLPQGLVEEQAGSPTNVYMREDPLLPFAWEAVYWPRTPGWQTVHTPNGAPSWWYVWDAGEWKALHRRERMEGTQQWIAARAAEQRPPSEAMEAHKILIAKGWFYLLFVLSAVFLWVERKI